VADTVEVVTEPVTDTVQAVAQPVADTVEAVTQPVADTVEAVTQPVTDTIDTVAQTDTVEPIVESGAEPVEPIAGPVAEPVETTVAPVAPLPVDRAPVVDEAQSGNGDTGSIGGLPLPIPDAAPLPGPGVVDPTESPLIPIDPTSEELLPSSGIDVTTSPVSVDPSVPSGSPMLGTDPVDIRSAATDEGSILDMLAPLSPSGENLSLITAGAVTLAGMALVARGSGPCLSGASILLSNVRLIPCVAADAISRGIATSQSAAGSVVRSVGGSPSTAVGAQHHDRARPSLGDEIEAIAGTIRDGFMRGAGRVSGELSDSDQDARLLRQLGVVLGTLYAAFLVAWFWATRLRWQVRS
jgi:hypothetical protein